MTDIKQVLNLEPAIKHTLLLRPHPASAPLDVQTSKMGGQPDMSAHSRWPVCITCEEPMRFVLQLYQEHFPQLYYPQGKNLFQLFRCGNSACANNHEDLYDQVTLHYYSQASRSVNSHIHFEPPVALPTGNAAVVPDCFFKARSAEDYPYYTDIPGFKAFNDEYGDSPTGDQFWEEYQPCIGTKINGYPSWTQYPDVPVCACGKHKTFFFQLASEDPQDGIDSSAPPWSPHSIMIGDLGNIYFFVCHDCGEKSIESRWDGG